MTTRDELSEIEETKKADHTELMRAALEGDTASVRALLVGEADVNAKDSEGRTALTKRSRASSEALKLAGHSAASKKALPRQARSPKQIVET